MDLDLQARQPVRVQQPVQAPVPVRHQLVRVRQLAHQRLPVRVQLVKLWQTHIFRH